MYGLYSSSLSYPDSTEWWAWTQFPSPLTPKISISYSATKKPYLPPPTIHIAPPLHSSASYSSPRRTGLMESPSYIAPQATPGHVRWSPSVVVLHTYNNMVPTNRLKWMQYTIENVSPPQGGLK